MKKRILTIMLSFFFITIAGQNNQNSILLGDANGDGIVNKHDIEEVYKYIINDISTISRTDNADVTKDGIINIADIVVIVNIIISANSETEDDIISNLTDEEKQIAIENAEKIDSRVSAIYVGTTGIDAIIPYINEIKQMDGVKNASIEDGAFVVELDCGANLAWIHVRNSVSQISSSQSPLFQARNIRRAVAAAEGAELMDKNAKMCIINAIPDDKVRSNEYTLQMFSALGQTYSKAGYSVTEVNGSSFNKDFINSSFTDYQIIALFAHGLYLNNLHWIVTGEHASISSFIDSYKIGNDNLIVKPVGDNLIFNPWFVAVSEKYLKTHMGSFNPNSILFAMTCQTLKGNNNLWNMFKGKGLGVFVGYDESIDCTYAINAMTMFYNNLIFYKESTTSKAFESIDPGLRVYRGERETVEGELEIFTANIGYRSQRDICLYEAEEIGDEEVVDLGLSVKWANCNLGAHKPTDVGTIYSEWEDFKQPLFENKELVAYTDYQTEMGELSGTILDPVKKELGGNWRLPTLDEMKELKNSCKWEEVVIDGVPCFKVTGPNDKYIFLPASEDVTTVDMGGMGGVIYSFGGSYYSGTYINGMQGLVFQSIVGPEFLTELTSPVISLEDVHDKSVIRPVIP